MKDVIDRLFSLGIGVAAVSKEQIEKIVDELSEKGKVTRQESYDMINELIKKGKETQEKWESTVNEKVEKVMRDMNVVTRKEFDELKARVEALEEQLQQKDQDD